ncbi:MAG: DMT family transporter [Actinomycetota bacterium]
MLSSRPVLSAVLGALAIAFSALLVRYADVSPVTAAVFRCVYALPALWLLARREDRAFGPRPIAARRLAWVAGILFALDLIFWHHAIEAVGAGLATVLGNLQVVIVGIIAWALLGEKPARSLLVAAPIALLGVVLISGVVGSNVYGDDPPLGVFYGILTALMYSGFILILRRGGSDLRRPAGPLFDATLAAAIVATLIGALSGGLDLAPEWPAHGWLIALALTSQVLGWLLISISLPRLPAALTSVLLTIQPVGSVFLGMLLLRERPSFSQLLGVALIVSGVVLAAAARRRSKEKVLEIEAL